ncbi:protein moonraker isoform X2 [Biomphalaria pfeifferi]|uniref:Protein moonraker isoform X2 n=1 Tax=Biomphalaria pfeifferi TaxID=112525 RepID=A0AAD8C9N5_BIOPF|nr:protein moonraker isoform X2 [Biomphalaria pfeifferi]
MNSDYSIPFRNQLQFNLNVPITTDKLAVQFQRPQPIYIERVSGHHTKAGKSVLRTSENHDSKKDHSHLFEETMSVMTQLARRDIQRGNLQTRNKASHEATVTKNKPPSSPQHSCHLHHKSYMKRQRLQHPVTGKEAEKNRMFGAVSTPPPQKPKALNESSIYLDKNISCVAAGQDEYIRLISEIQNYFQILQNFLERALATDNAEIVPETKGKQKDGFLYQEETTDRAQHRAEENKVRCVRTVYNLTQKVKQLQKDVFTCDMNNLVKKSHMTAQLVAIYRGCAKTLQMFMNQLPFQKLESCLPSHYHDLDLLLRSLFSLSQEMHKEDNSDQLKQLVTLMDKIDNLNSHWSLKGKKKVSPANKKLSGQTWVSDTKVDKNIFVTKDNPQVILMAQKKASKVPKNQPTQRQAQQKKGKENIFNMGKSAQRSHYASEPNPRPAIGPSIKRGTSYFHNKQVIDKPAVGNMKTLEGGIKNIKDVNFDLGKKQTVSVQRYQTTGTSPISPSDLNSNTSSPFYVEGLNNEDIRQIFQDESYTEDISSSIVDNIKLHSKDTSTCSYADRTETTLRDEDTVLDISVRETNTKTVQADAAAMCDLPSLEAIRLRLAEMQVCHLLSLEARRLRLAKVQVCDEPSLEAIRLRLAEMQVCDEPSLEAIRLRLAEMQVCDEPPLEAIRLRLAEMQVCDEPSLEAIRLRLAEMQVCDEPSLEARRLRLAKVQVCDEPSLEAIRLRLAEMQVCDEPSLESIRLRLADMQVCDEPSLEARRLRLAEIQVCDEPSLEAIRLRLAEMQVCDEPSLETRRLRLAEVQREKQEIQQRWSTFQLMSSSQNLHSKTGKHPIKSTETHVTWSPETDKSWTERRGYTERLVEKEPILFTKPLREASATHREPVRSEQHYVSLLQGKQLLKLNQTSVEKIVQNQKQFEKYLKSISHHPTGKFNPWQLIEELSDEILMDCLQEVGREIETINEEIAKQMFASEFLVDKSSSEIPHLIDSCNPENYIEEIAHQKFASEFVVDKSSSEIPHLKESSNIENYIEDIANHMLASEFLVDKSSSEIHHTDDSSNPENYIEDIANHMLASEFLVDKSSSEIHHTDDSSNPESYIEDDIRDNFVSSTEEARFQS